LQRPGAWAERNKDTCHDCDHRSGKLDSGTARFTGGFYPIRQAESVLELTYQAQVAPWWQVQPTAQDMFNPNGGVPNPQRPEKRLRGAGVLGLPTTVTF